MLSLFDPFLAKILYIFIYKFNIFDPPPPHWHWHHCTSANPFQLNHRSFPLFHLGVRSLLNYPSDCHRRARKKKTKIAIQKKTKYHFYFGRICRFCLSLWVCAGPKWKTPSAFVRAKVRRNVEDKNTNQEQRPPPFSGPCRQMVSSCASSRLCGLR